MKIIIPVDEDEEKVCIVFARAPYFMAYNTDDNTIEIIENPAAKEQGGAGIKAAQFVVDLNGDILITVRLGQNSADVLNAANIKIYKSLKEKASENIEAFQNNELSELTQFHAGYHGVQ